MTGIVLQPTKCVSKLSFLLFGILDLSLLHHYQWLGHSDNKKTREIILGKVKSMTQPIVEAWGHFVKIILNNWTPIQ